MPSTRRDSSTQNHSTPTPTSVSTLEAALWRLIPHIMLPIYGIFYEPVTDNVTVKRKPKKSKKGKRGKRAHGQRVADDESRTEMLDRDVVVRVRMLRKMRNVVGTLADVDGEGGVNEANTRDLDNDIAVFSPIHKPDDGSLSSPKTPNVMPDDSTIPFFKSLPQDPMNVRPNDSFLPSPKTLSQFPKVMPDDSSIPTPSQDPNFTPPVVDAGYPVQTKQKPKKKKNKKPESNFVIGSSVWAMQKECSSSTMVDISELMLKFQDISG
ncbi:hypothetical protein BC829DRAFT_259058 [Chytridium lagenaria]|nr:hypothetical protein BC829DRAFT_259058 [Chytridium lagenaria]